MKKDLKSFDQDITAAVIGASGGIGRALVQNLIAQPRVKSLYAFSRSYCDLESDKIIKAHIDIADEISIKTAASTIEKNLDLLIIATGILDDGKLLPEKSLRDLDIESMRHCFTVNTFGPALVAKYFIPHLPRERRSVFAALSARVGSISDNHLGGWYSYRASKAALNMMIKNTSIEVGRRYKHAVILGLHPGTVKTELSQPFQKNVKHDIFTPTDAANHLLTVIDKVTPEDTGKCFAWDGQELPS